MCYSISNTSKNCPMSKFSTRYGLEIDDIQAMTGIGEPDI